MMTFKTFQDAISSHKQELPRDSAADGRVDGLLQRPHHADAAVSLREGLRHVGDGRSLRLIHARGHTRRRITGWSNRIRN